MQEARTCQWATLKRCAPQSAQDMICNVITLTHTACTAYTRTLLCRPLSSHSSFCVCYARQVRAPHRWARAVIEDFATGARAGAGGDQRVKLLRRPEIVSMCAAHSCRALVHRRARHGRWLHAACPRPDCHAVCSTALLTLCLLALESDSGLQIRLAQRVLR